MITTRTRILSFLATVAMLVSMLACFVIPASAAEMTEADKVKAWQQVILAADLANTTAIKAAVPKSYNAWYSASKNKGKNQVNGAWVAPTEDNPAATSEDIKAAVIEEFVGKIGPSGDETKTLHWKNFDGTTVPYPKFEYYDQFLLADYDGLNWSISDVDDWNAMDAVANATGEAVDARLVNAETGEYFEGMTFHLTTDVSLTGVYYPMGVQTTVKRIFRGNIDGHGFGFEDVNMTASATAFKNNTIFDDAASGSTSINESFGLIGYIGSCTIQNVGINNGTIKGPTGNAGSSVSTFGSIVAGASITFNKIWCGANLYATASPIVNPIVGHDGSAKNCEVKVNGFTYYGKATESTGDNHNLIYGVHGGYTVAPAATSTFSNIITYPEIANAGNPAFLFGAGADDSADAFSNYTISNVYGVKRDPETKAAGIGFDYDYRCTLTSKTYTGNNANPSYLGTMAPEKAAWTFNGRQSEAAAPVYFTLVDGGIRPTGTVDNAIVQLTLTGFAEKEVYVNKGTAYTKAMLAKELGVAVAALDVVTVDGAALEGDSFTVTGDHSIAVTISKVKALAVVVAKYASLETKYLTADAAAALEAFRAEADEATEDTAQAVMDKEDDLIAALETYSDYDNAEADGKEIPAYSEYATYGAYNEAKVWLIKEAKDWTDMIAASATETFDGYSFHLVDHVKFNNQPMKPLAYKTAFRGNIYGHGYGFDDILINGTTIGTIAADVDVGLIAKITKGTIEEFGINSGAVDCSDANGNGDSDVGALFGAIAPSSGEVIIKKCWNGADVDGFKTGTQNVSAGALAGSINSNGSGVEVTINGFINTGDVTTHCTNKNETYVGVVHSEGVAHGWEGGVFNVLNTGLISGLADSTHELTTRGSMLLRVKVNAGLEKGQTRVKNNAVLAYEGDNAKYTPLLKWHIPSGYTPTETDYVEHAQPIEFTQAQYDSGEIGYLLNQNNVGLTGRTGNVMDTVYFALDAAGKITFGKDDGSNQIVKLTMTGDSVAPIYVNKGSELTAALLAEKLDAPAAAITFEVTEGAVTEGIIAGDATINVSIDKTLVLKAEWAEYYNTLDPMYLTISAEEWENFNEAVAASTNENADALAAEMATLIDGLETYSTYPEADGKEIPAYTLFNTYSAYNTNNNWKIKTPADWKAMMTAVDGVAFENNVYFAGYTFHLTDDVDFDGENWLTPMGVGTDNKTADYTPKYFGGTINGHGFGFENFRVYAHTQTNAAACDADYLKPGYQSGNSYTLTEQTTAMFYRLGNCRIENFGVNSGWIVGYAGNQQGHVSTFGGLMDGYAPTLTNVWSYANLRGSGNQYVSALVGVADGGSYSSAAVINGAYFGGTMSCSWTNGTRAAYAILGERDAAVGANALLTNIIANPEVFQAKQGNLDANVTANSTYTDVAVDRGDYHKFVMFSVADTAIPAGYANIYGISGTNKLDGAYVKGGAQSTVLDREGNSLMKTDAKEAAWTINNNQLDGVDAVYFTLVGDQIRPVSTADKAIVKVTSKVGDAPAEESYYNNGDVLSLTEDFGIAVVAGADITVNGVAHTADAITLAGDTEIVVTYNLSADATAALLPYEGLEAKYFSNGAELDAMRALLVKEGVTNDELQSIIDWAATNVPVVWGADNYTKLPAYTEYAKYAAYNTAKNWAITEAADWLAMVEASKVENGGETFEGYTFHVLNDIDFDGQRMDPLNFDGTVASTAMTNPFKGTIDGHGNALLDICIKFANSGEDVTLTASGDTFAGIIGSMAGGAVIRDFGVDSGSIFTSVGYMDLGTFGHVKNGQIATLQNVWSGVALSTTKTNGAIGGILAYPYKGKVTVNGAYFFGSATGTSEVSAIGGGNVRDCVAFYNTIGAPTTAVSNSMHWTDKTGLSFANNFAVGYDTVYSWGSGQEIEGIDNTDVKAASPEAAGYRVNIAQNDEQTFAKVYYTITEDGVRPTSDATNAIVKVTLTGTKTGELYVNKNSTATVAAIAAALGVDVADVLKIDGADAADVAIAGDTTLNVELYVCDHSANTNDPVWDSGNYHHTICSECGEAFNRTKCSGTKVPTFDPETKEATHYVICTVCSNKIVAKCDKGSLYVNPDDCTANHKWVFTECSVHKGDYAEYVLEGTGNATHTYEGEWIQDGDQEYRQCVNCTTKEYRNVCQHTEKVYTWVEGTETHKITCANTECGADLGTVDCGGAWVAGDVNVETGASEHTKTCPDCKKDYVEACQGTKVPNPDDCTAAGKWTFDCELHEDVAAAPEYTAHDFSASEWAPAEGGAGTKQAKTCAHCSAKLYRYIGGVNAAGVELKADAAGNIVLTLPVALKSAKLTFTVPAGYSITAVEGATAGDGFYTVSNIEAGAPITITVDSALTAVGGTFGVEVTEAIAADDAEVTNAVAQATIGFTAKNGDANGDEAVNLSDALAVLYKVVGQEGAADINVVNANVVAPTTTSVDVNDVYEIVRIWLRESVFTL